VGGLKAGVHCIGAPDAAQKERGGHQQQEEKATCATSSVLATVTRRRLRPAVRPASFSVSATLARDALMAGIMPNISPVGQRYESAKTNTTASIFGSGKFAAPVICQQETDALPGQD